MCDASLIFPSGSQSILFTENFLQFFYQKLSDLEVSLIFKQSQKGFYFNLLMDYGNSKINLIYEYKKKTTRSTLQETMKKHTDFSPN